MVRIAGILRHLFIAAIALAAFSCSVRAQISGYPAFYPPMTSGNCVQANSAFQATTTAAPCGVGTVSPGTINQLAWYAATGNTVSGLPTANNGVLATSAGGVPSIASTLPSAVQDNITRTGTLVSGATGAGYTLAIGTSTVTGVLPAANGGAGTVTGALRANGSGLVTQAACADLSNGATGCSTSIGTSGATIPLLSTANTWTLAQTWSTISTGSAGLDAQGGRGQAKASTLELGWASGNGHVFSMGADSSTNGGFLIRSYRSDASNAQDVLSAASNGVVGIGTSAAASGSLGNLILPKITASGNAPAAGIMKLEVVAGTNAGSCKLQAYAGTSATPVTIVDNVGTGC